MHDIAYVTQYNKRYILSTFEKIEIFALSNRRLNKLSNDTQFIQIEVMILFENTSFTKCEFLSFSLYFTHCFVHYLRRKPGRQDVPFVSTGSHIKENVSY